MKLFVIATIRKEKKGEIVGYRILNFETGEVYIVGKAYIESSIDKFININRQNMDNILINLPSIDLKGKLTTGNSRVVLARNTRTGDLLTSSYKGTTAAYSVQDIYNLYSQYSSKEIEFKYGTTRQNINEDSIVIHCNIEEVSSNTILIKKYPEFELKVYNEFNNFIAKSKLMGIDNGFNYHIKGHTVILSKYTGTSEDVIIPSFVNVIAERAFQTTAIEIKKLKLTDGLREIQAKAFQYNDIKEVDIPTTVEFIGENAFFDNEGLTIEYVSAKNGERVCQIDKSKLRISNKYTVVEPQCSMFSNMI